MKRVYTRVKLSMKVSLLILFTKMRASYEFLHKEYYFYRVGVALNLVLSPHSHELRTLLSHLFKKYMSFYVYLQELKMNIFDYFSF